MCTANLRVCDEHENESSSLSKVAMIRAVNVPSLKDVLDSNEKKRSENLQIYEGTKAGSS